MTYLQAIIFGLIQGITEFLPISSTAHIIIVELLMGFDFPGLAFEIYLHLASALAVIIYFYRDLYEIIRGFIAYIIKRNKKDKVSFYFAIYIIIATFITGSLGLLLKNSVVDVMKTPYFMGSALIFTAFFLVFIERMHEYGNIEEKDMTYRHAIIVGLGQTLAVLPGISRSGTTLVASLWSGLSRETAVRYSFILVIPVILGSTVLAVGEIGSGMWSSIGTGPLIVSFLSSFIFSIIGIVWLIDILRKSRLIYLAVYCFIVAGLLFAYANSLVL
ncbi:undecaprenyl-diphosphate phosphatase [Natronospora cellulosivora (SeqCode)]